MRVREIISYLSYKDLVERNVIPDILSTFKVKSVKYPVFIYKQENYALFGMFMDYIVRKGLRSLEGVNVSLGTDPISEFISMMSECEERTQLSNNYKLYVQDGYFGKAVTATLQLVQCDYPSEEQISESDIVKFIPRLTNIIKALKQEWIEKKLNLNLQYNVEYKYFPIEGHPDVVLDDTILDIKNTAGFKTIGEESCLQVLAYYALAKQNPRCTINKIGFIFPMQGKIEVIDVSTWESSIFMNEMINIASAYVI